MIAITVFGGVHIKTFSIHSIITNDGRKDLLSVAVKSWLSEWADNVKSAVSGSEAWLIEWIEWYIIIAYDKTSWRPTTLICVTGTVLCLVLFLRLPVSDLSINNVKGYHKITRRRYLLVDTMSGSEIPLIRLTVLACVGPLNSASIIFDIWHAKKPNKTMGTSLIVTWAVSISLAGRICTCGLWHMMRR